METKIHLQHPTGKKAVSMEKEKYEALKKSILKNLKTSKGLTHPELLQAVMEDFKNNKTKFDGSVEWHTEWVKLDLEARKEIQRVGDKPVKYMVKP